MGKRKYLGLFIFILLVVILNLPVSKETSLRLGCKNSTAPFQNVLHLIISRISDSVSAIVNISGLQNERLRLLSEISSLKLSLAESRTAMVENDYLRQMLALKKHSDKKLIAAEIISRGDSLGWWQTITINKGADDGIKPNMPVISLDGLVGKVDKNVSKDTADIVLLTERTCKVAVELPRTGTTGILQGRGINLKNKKYAMLCNPHPFLVNYVDKNIEIMPGKDLVVSSGLGGVFPRGLLVGYVEDYHMDSSGLYQQIDVIPAVDFSKLKYVFVISD